MSEKMGRRDFLYAVAAGTVGIALGLYAKSFNIFAPDITRKAEASYFVDSVKKLINEDCMLRDVPYLGNINGINPLYISGSASKTTEPGLNLFWDKVSKQRTVDMIIVYLRPGIAYSDWWLPTVADYTKTNLRGLLPSTYTINIKTETRNLSGIKDKMSVDELTDLVMGANEAYLYEPSMIHFIADSDISGTVCGNTEDIDGMALTQQLYNDVGANFSFSERSSTSLGYNYSNMEQASMATHELAHLLGIPACHESLCFTSHNELAPNTTNIFGERCKLLGSRYSNITPVKFTIKVNVDGQEKDYNFLQIIPLGKVADTTAKDDYERHLKLYLEDKANLKGFKYEMQSAHDDDTGEEVSTFTFGDKSKADVRIMYYLSDAQVTDEGII